MPIRINLKELFPADAQEITIDKINFNFNKLLELGVGDTGPIGLSGIQGAAGPVGGTGSQGVRGSTWLVDGGAPTVTTGLLDGDLYLDSNALAVYQWDAATSTWNFLFDISAIIQNYLNAAASPFVRGLGTGSPNDQRFIVFGKKDGLTGDDYLKSANSTNDVLFLSNYDETVIVPPNNIPALGGSPDTTDFYSALLNISVDQRALLPNLRSHIELGLLYDPANPTLTSIAENFKVRYDRIDSSKHVGLDHFNRTSFSIDIPDSFLSTERNFSSILAIESPKYKPDLILYPSGASSERSVVLIGSRYGLDEEAPNALSGDTLADGIVFYTSPTQAGGNIGTAVNYRIAGITGVNTGYFNFASNTQSYFMLDPIGAANSIFLRKTVYQNEGNLIQLGTGAARLTGAADLRILSSASPLACNTAMAQQGNRTFAIFARKTVTNISSGGTYASTYNEVTIENPNLPKNYISALYSGAPSSASSIPDFAAISDIAVAGDYMYCVKNLSNYLLPSVNTITLQSIKLSEASDERLPTRVGYINSVTSPSYLLFDSAHRIKLRGNLAVISTNALYTGTSTVALLGGHASHDGNIVLADITCPQDLKIVDYAIAPKIDPFSQLAILDTAVVDDFVYTLTWEQLSTAPDAKVKVKVDVFSIEEADAEPATAISWLSASSNTFISGTSSITPTQYSELSKVGAICANKQYVYAGYAVSTGGSTYVAQIKTYSIPGGFTVFSASTGLSLSSNLTLSIPGEQISEVNRIEQFGNSIYVLVNTVSAGSYLIKADVSNPSSTFQVWYKQVGTSAEYYSNFIINGKHIYVANSKPSGIIIPPTPNSALKAFEIDGFYTGGAHIESLRADAASIMKNLSVGNNAVISNELNVGGRAEITGELGVGTRLRMCGRSYFTGDSSNSNIIANIVNGSGALVIKNASASNSSALKLVNGANTYLELASVPGSNKAQMVSNYDLDIKVTNNDINIETQTAGSITITALNSFTATAIDGVNFTSANDINVNASVNINLNAESDVNVDADNGNGKFYVKANNHFAYHSTPINGSKNDDIFLSGVYTGPVRPGSTDNMIIIWQRVGNVVRCSAKIDYFGTDGSGSDPNTSTFQLPYYTNGASYSSGTTFLYIYGHGHGLNYGSNVYYVLPFGHRGGQLGLGNTTPISLGNHTIIVEFSYDLL